MLNKILRRKSIQTPTNALISLEKNTKLEFYGEEQRAIHRLDEPIPVRLAQKDELATDTFVYRMIFDDEHANKALGHLTCQYLQFEADIEGQTFTRFYHPMSKVTDEGYIDLLIKVYLRNFQHQQGGLFTQFIDKMKVGQGGMRITGIGGDIGYMGDSVFQVRDPENREQMLTKKFDRVGMIAAGSGITPMFQLAQTVVDANRGDKTALSLIYSNRTPYDIILDEDLTDFEKMGKLCYFPLVQNPDEQWTFGQGKINKEMISNLMPEPLLLGQNPKSGEEDSVIIVCGPPKLKESMREIMAELGWNNAFYFN